MGEPVTSFTWLKKQPQGITCHETDEVKHQQGVCVLPLQYPTLIFLNSLRNPQTTESSVISVATGAYHATRQTETNDLQVFLTSDSIH